MAIGGRSSQGMSILNQYEDLKVIFLTVRPSIKSVSYKRDSISKEKSGVKNGWELVPLRGGGVRRLMANAIKKICIFLTLPLVLTEFV